VPASPAYPATRPDRAEAAQPISAPNPTYQPQTRAWPFRVGATVVNTRSIAVGGPFQGPAIIKAASWSWGSAATADANFSLYYSDDGSGAGTNLPATTRPSGTPIFEPIAHQTPSVADGDELREHFDQTQAGFTNAQPLQHVLNYYVPRAGQFFLKAMVRNGAVGTFDMKGIISIVENVPPELAANFL